MYNCIREWKNYQQKNFKGKYQTCVQYLKRIINLVYHNIQYMYMYISRLPQAKKKILIWAH